MTLLALKFLHLSLKQSTLNQETTMDEQIHFQLRLIFVVIFVYMEKKR